MAHSDHVSTPGEFFGIPTGADSTNAPGSGGLANALGAAGAPTSNLSPVGGTHTTDGTPVHHTLSENIFGIVDQSGMAHGGVEAAQGNSPLVGGAPDSTNAGKGTPGHNIGRNPNAGSSTLKNAAQ